MLMHGADVCVHGADVCVHGADVRVHDVDVRGYREILKPCWTGTERGSKSTDFLHMLFEA